MGLGPVVAMYGGRGGMGRGGADRRAIFSPLAVGGRGQWRSGVIIAAVTGAGRADLGGRAVAGPALWGTAGSAVMRALVIQSRLGGTWYGIA